MDATVDMGTEDLGVDSTAAATNAVTSERTNRWPWTRNSLRKSATFWRPTRRLRDSSSDEEQYGTYILDWAAYPSFTNKSSNGDKVLTKRTVVYKPKGTFQATQLMRNLLQIKRKNVKLKLVTAQTTAAPTPFYSRNVGQDRAGSVNEHRRRINEWQQTEQMVDNAIHEDRR